MSLIKAAGIDLAKLVFSIHDVDSHDKCKLRKTIKRNKLLAEVSKLPPCAEPHAGWCGGWRVETSRYPI
jgi:transposase